MDTLPQLAVAHLLLRLQPLNRTLRAAVEAQRMEAESLSQPELKALCVTDQQVLGLLEKVSSHRAGKSTCATLTEEERERERDLQDRAQAIAVTLPLDKMAQQLGLTDFEREAILVCAAPEQDRAYERIYAYILDDLNRRFPCVELLTGLTCASIEERAERRHALSIFGKLRRFGLLSPINDPPTQLRQEFRLGNDVLEFLSGAGEQLVHRYLDSEEIQVPDCAGPPCQVDQNQFEHLAAGLREGSIAAVGIWGARQHGLDDVVLALASASHCQLRRLPAHRFDQGGPEFSQMLEEQFRIATGLRAAVCRNGIIVSAWLRAVSALACGSTVPLFRPGHPHR